MSAEILTEKSYKNYDHISRYSTAPYYFHTLDKKYISGTTHQLSQDNSYLIHKVKGRDTFDSLSLKYYNSPLYFWVIMDFNHFQDPFETLEEGTELKIPTLASIKFEVNK